MKNPKPSLRVCSFTGSFLACLFAIGTGSVSAQSLTWDPNGNTAPNPSDGAGNWLDANVWWDGAANVGWNNVTNASTTAIFGNTAVATGTGQAGAITLTGGVSAGGLQIGSVDLSTDLLTGYSFSGGTLTLANNGRIELFAGSTDSNPIAQRLRFMATSVLAGSNITIANNVTGNTGFGLVTLSGSNTWTGTLGLTGNSGGLFIEATTINALSSLGAINVNANASLVLNYASGILNVPITMGGSGAGQRGALRFDQSRTVSSNITLSAATRIATNGSTVTGTLSGNISGSSGLVMDHTGTTAIGGIVFTGNNTYTTLSVVKGNAQIGVAGVGTSGTGNVTGNLREGLEIQIAALRADLKKVNKELSTHIAAHPDLDAKSKRLVQFKGVSPVLAATLLAHLPELGEMEDRKIASLAGVAPHPKDGGTSKFRRREAGGRV